MNRQSVVLALLVAAIVSACGGTATPAPSSVAVAGPSASAGSASAAPSASPSARPSSSPTTAPTATPAPTPTLAPTPKPTPVPWKTFTSKRYHYLIKYPPDWIVTPGAAGISDQFDNYDYPYIYVSRDTVGGTVSLSLTVTHVIATTKTHYKAKLVSNNSIRLAGWSGRLLKFTGTSVGQKVAMQFIILAKGSAVYFIDLIGDVKNTVPDRALFRKMYLTWRPK